MKRGVINPNKLSYLLVGILVVAIGLFFINIERIFDITGRAVGTANLTIESRAQINFTTNIIDWGSGAVDSGQENATLNTAGGAANITNGNWTGNTAGLVIENIGNINVSIDIKTGKTASTFIGGSSSSYQYNVTNIEAGSCANVTGFNLGLFYDVNITDPGTGVCSDFTYNDTRDTIRIDIKLVIPSDASQTGSAIGDVITVTATAI